MTEITLSPFALMPEILDKLRLLDYEKQFCEPRDFPVLNNLYFALQSTDSSQFLYFASLCVWLLKDCGIDDLNYPNEYDEPNLLSQDIQRFVNELYNKVLQEDNKEIIDRTYEINPLGFRHQNIREGYGIEVCWILNFLLELSCSQKNSAFITPQFEIEELVDKIEEELNELDFDEEEEDSDMEEGEAVVITDFQIDSGKKVPGKKGELKRSDSEFLNMEKWLEEVERVAPKLKLDIRTTDNWKVQLAQLERLHNGLKGEVFNNSKNFQKFIIEMEKTIEKLQIRENYISENFEEASAEHRVLATELSKENEIHNDLQKKLANLSNTLVDVTDRLEIIKSQMDMKGSSMKDTVPLDRIKNAKVDLEKEMKEMRLRQGMLQHALLQSQIQSKR
eukprot:TRINITY_DN1870_c0_g1_i1.p1 TRINITY_DN1870_c0_g1~~TRINITY_DN1870_c0_g1_i1.p1  ORF type:complete len:392 (+),score=142.61 TRINITY_DN1870_c0_g1_i1:37-1212(+)